MPNGCVGSRLPTGGARRLRVRQRSAGVILRLVMSLGFMVHGLAAQTTMPEVRLEDVAQPRSLTFGINRPAHEAKSNYRVAGAVVGAVAGAVGGWALQRAITGGFCDPADNTEFYTCNRSGPTSAESAFVGAVVGALLGGMIGSVISSPQNFSVYPFLGVSSGQGLSAGAFIPLRIR